jgi:branched-chain amino acid transport system ATP-binding protein
MQMLAIARAIAARARILLLDEPSRGLAPLVVGEVYRALAAIRRQHAVRGRRGHPADRPIP